MLIKRTALSVSLLLLTTIAFLSVHLFDEPPQQSERDSDKAASDYQTSVSQERHNHRTTSSIGSDPTTPISNSRSPLRDPRDWSGATILQESIEYSDSEHSKPTLRHRIIQDKGFDFPIRITDAIEFDPNGTPQKLFEVSAYAANQILLHSPDLFSDNDIEAIADVLGWRYRESEGSQFIAVLQTNRVQLETVQNALLVIESSELPINAEPNHIFYATNDPNDPKYTQGHQWGLHNASDNDIDAHEGWDIRTSAAEVTIAIVDSGINLEHEDLIASLWTNRTDSTTNGQDEDNNGVVDDIFGYNAISPSEPPLDDYGHGTHVAGIAGATGNNGKGVSGVAWTTKLMSVKALNADGRGATNLIAKALDYAIDNGADIINASWGSSSYSESLDLTIAKARDNDIIVVASAGNDGSAFPSYPGRSIQENVLTVGAFNRSGEKSLFSNYNDSSVDVFAPGEAILSTSFEANNSYSLNDGTSMAASFVSGILALTQSAFPNDTLREYKRRILASSTPREGFEVLSVSEGIVNLHAALEMKDVPFPPELVNTTSDSSRLYEGESSKFSIQVVSESPVTFEWYLNGNLLSETSNELTIEEATASDAGNYNAIATNSDASISVTFPLIVYSRMPEIEANLDFEAQVFASNRDHWKVVEEGGVSTIVNENIPAGTIAFLEFRIPQSGLVRAIGKVDHRANASLRTAMGSEGGRKFFSDEYWETIDAEYNSEFTVQFSHYSNNDESPIPENTFFLQHPEFFETGKFPPILTERIDSQSLKIGERIYLEVFSLQGDLTYQWFKNDAPIDGETTPALDFYIESGNQNGLYHVVVSNPFGTYRSSSAFVEVDTSPVAASAVIVGDDTLRPLAGEPLALKMDVFGQKPITYQWYRNGDPIPGATSPTLDLGLASIAHSGQYYLYVENQLNQVPFRSPLLRVYPDEQIFPPEFRDTQSAPLTYRMPIGSDFSKTLTEPAGSYPFSYTWVKDGDFLEEDSPSNTLRIESLTESGAGTYYLVATNMLGSAQSRRISIIVTPSLNEALDTDSESIHSPIRTEYGDNQVFYQSIETYDGEDAIELHPEGPVPYLNIEPKNYDRAVRFFWKLSPGDSGQFHYEISFTPDTPIASKDIWIQEVAFVPKNSLLKFRVLGNSNETRAWLDSFEEIREPFVLENISFSPPINGGPVTLGADVLGSNLTYQWYKDDSMIPGATSESYLIESFSQSDEGDYHLKIENEWGDTTTNIANVTFSIPNSVIEDFASYTFLENTNLRLLRDPSDESGESLFLEATEKDVGPWGFTTQVTGPATFYISHELDRTEVTLALDGNEIPFETNNGEREDTFIFVPSGDHTLSFTAFLYYNSHYAKIFSIAIEEEPIAVLNAGEEIHYNQYDVPKLRIEGVEPLSITWFKNGNEISTQTDLTSGSYYPYNRDTVGTDQGLYSAEVTDGNGLVRESNSIALELNDYLDQILDTKDSYVSLYHDGDGKRHFDEEIFVTGNSSLRLQGPFTTGFPDPAINFRSNANYISLKLRSEGFSEGEQIRYRYNGVSQTVTVNQDWTELVIDHEEYGVYLNLPSGSENSKLWIDDYQNLDTPFFRTQPQDISTFIGSEVTLNALASSPSEYDLTLKWFKDGVEIPTDGSSSLRIDSLTLGDLGEYVAQAVSASGTVTNSRTARVSLTSRELSNAIGYPGARITTIGPSPWVVDYEDSTDGASSIKSGYLEKGERTTIIIDIDGNVAWGLYYYRDLDLTKYARSLDNRWIFESANYLPHLEVSRFEISVEEPDGQEKFNKNLRLDGVRVSRMSGLRYDQWIKDKLASQIPQIASGLQDRIADSDGDSIPNWLEFVLNLDPSKNDKLPTWGLSEQIQPGSSVVLEFLAARSGDYSIHYEASYDLETWFRIKPNLESVEANTFYDKVTANISLDETGDEPYFVRWSIHLLSEDSQNVYSK